MPLPSRWRRQTIRRAFGLGLAIALAAPASAQPVPDSGDPAPAATYAFEFDASQRMTVAVRIAGSGPYGFIVDTGATKTVIARELAERLALSPGPNAKVHSMTEARVTPTVLIPSLHVNGRTLTALKAPTLAGADLQAAGYLGLDALQAQRVVIDFQAGTMAVAASAAAREESWRGDEIVVTAKNRFGQLVIADADVDGERVHVIVDTGAAVSIGNDALRRRLFGAKKPRPWSQIELVSVTGGTAIADYTVADRMRIAGMRITAMPIAFGDVHAFRALELTDRPALLLGMDTLRMFDRVTLDFARRKIWFQWSRAALPPGLREANDAPATKLSRRSAPEATPS